jgi:CheY-like chemotaxis protein
MRVLIVDDMEDQRESLALLLRLLGHETHLAQDGPSALNAAQTFHPDAVLLDIGMPKMNGYEVAQHLRKQDEFADVLLVALSGFGTEEDKVRSHDAGFDAHLTKPSDLTELQQLLENAMSAVLP